MDGRQPGYCSDSACARHRFEVLEALRNAVLHAAEHGRGYKHRPQAHDERMLGRTQKPGRKLPGKRQDRRTEHQRDQPSEPIDMRDHRGRPCLVCVAVLGHQHRGRQTHLQPYDRRHEANRGKQQAVDAVFEDAQRACYQDGLDERRHALDGGDARQHRGIAGERGLQQMPPHAQQGARGRCRLPPS